MYCRKPCSSPFWVQLQDVLAYCIRRRKTNPDLTYISRIAFLFVPGLWSLFVRCFPPTRRVRLPRHVLCRRALRRLRFRGQHQQVSVVSVVKRGEVLRSTSRCARLTQRASHCSSCVDCVDSCLLLGSPFLLRRRGKLSIGRERSTTRLRSEPCLNIRGRPLAHLPGQVASIDQAVMVL